MISTYLPNKSVLNTCTLKVENYRLCEEHALGIQRIQGQSNNIVVKLHIRKKNQPIT